MLAAMQLSRHDGVVQLTTERAAALIAGLAQAPTEAAAWALVVDAGIPLAKSRGFVREWWPRLYIVGDNCDSCGELLTAANYAASDGPRAWCTQCAHGGKL